MTEFSDWKPTENNLESKPIDKIKFGEFVVDLFQKMARPHARIQPRIVCTRQELDTIEKLKPCVGCEYFGRDLRDCYNAGCSYPNKACFKQKEKRND